VDASQNNAPGEFESFPPTGGQTIKQVVILLILGIVLYVGWHGAVSGWELQRRVACAANLKGIGTSAKIYGADLDWGDTPAVLEALIASGAIVRAQTICPGYNGPASNYRLVPAAPVEGKVDDRAIIAYEPKSNHRGEGGNVLYADGHANFVGVPEYDRLIESIEVVRKEPVP